LRAIKIHSIFINITIAMEVPQANLSPWM
jgi:hypothetical protein